MSSIWLNELSDSELIELRTKVNEMLVHRRATDWTVIKHFIINRKYGGFSLSREGLDLYNKLNTSEKYITSCDIPRHDPYLVEVVQTLGKKANGSHTDLSIVTKHLIPGQIVILVDDDGIEKLYVKESNDIKNLEWGNRILYMV